MCAESHPIYIAVCHDLVITLSALSKYQEALTLSTEVLKSNEETYGPEHPRTASILFEIGPTYTKESNHTTDYVYSAGLAKFRESRQF